MEKSFKVGYAHDREFKSALNNVYEKYVLNNRLLYLKTKHAINQLFVPSDNRLITSILRQHHDGNTAAHPGICRTQLNVTQ